jgi:hypothetical protein
MVIDPTPTVYPRVLILLEGPAKVYTLRGKYRQYFLRVNAYGEAEYGSANLRVDKDRTLQVAIEAIVRHITCQHRDPPDIGIEAWRTHGPSSVSLIATASHSATNDTDVTFHGKPPHVRFRLHEAEAI